MKKKRSWPRPSADQVKLIRSRHAKLTQQAMADELRVSLSHYQRWEQAGGTRMPPGYWRLMRIITIGQEEKRVKEQVYD